MVKNNNSPQDTKLSISSKDKTTCETKDMNTLFSFSIARSERAATQLRNNVDNEIVTRSVTKTNSDIQNHIHKKHDPATKTACNVIVKTAPTGTDYIHDNSEVGGNNDSKINYILT